nr:hypothetical protein [Tanacetum cinerariifolium]
RLDLPSLREQPGNILPLAEYFLGIYSQRLDFAMPLISEAAQQRGGNPSRTPELARKTLSIDAPAGRISGVETAI